MKLNQLLLAAGMAVALCLSVDSALAQQGGGGGGQGGGRGGRGGGPGGGNFDPAQMQQRMMDRYKEQLEITDETEWKAIQPLVQKVMEARMASFSGRGGFGRGGGRPGGDTTQGDQGNQRRGGFGTPSPEAEALQKAIDAKASSSELKAAMTKYAEARKAKQADLEKAQAELRKVLSVRQEAIATASGLL
jgi:hypothetical protein